MKKSIIAALLLSLVACSPKAPVSNAAVAFSIEQSHTTIKAGESVTFTAHATNVAGRDDKIKWTADDGSLELLNGKDRYARVKFERPGTYPVKAALYVDGNKLDEEEVLVQVEPLF